MDRPLIMDIRPGYMLDRIMEMVIRGTITLMQTRGTA